MNFLRKCSWRALWVLALAVAVLHNPVASASAVSESSGQEKEYLKTVYSKMAAVDSAHFDILMQAVTPMGQVDLTMAGEGKAEPMAYKSDIKISYRDLQNKENTMVVKQYIEQDKDQMTCYSFFNEKWIKQVVPYVDPLGHKPSAAAKAKMTQAMLELIKDVKTQEETPAYKDLAITLDGAKLGSFVQSVLQQGNHQNKELLTMQQEPMIQAALQNLGDMKYTLRVDKHTDLVTETKMDLTDPVRKSATAFLAASAMKPEAKAGLKDFLAKSTLQVQVKYSKINAVDKVEIPQAVREQAQEVKIAEQPESVKA